MNTATQRPGSLDSRTRVRHGRERERQIATALKDQCDLPITEASEHEDRERKVDRWIAYPTGKVALQIKYRESGDDLLFEVYDKFFGWDDEKNKLGRDMYGDAQEYAVLLTDKKTVVMVPTDSAKDMIAAMVLKARTKGFTRTGFTGATLDYFIARNRLQLKIQRDPADGRQKMVAYIPASYFIDEAQAKVYEVALPKQWKI